MTLDLKGWIGNCQLGCKGNFKLRKENRIREATGIWSICITEWVSLNHFICSFEFELSGNNLKLSTVCWNWLASTFRRDIYKELRDTGLGGKKKVDPQTNYNWVLNMSGVGTAFRVFPIWGKRTRSLYPCISNISWGLSLEEITLNKTSSSSRAEILWALLSLSQLFHSAYVV